MFPSGVDRDLDLDLDLDLELKQSEYCICKNTEVCYGLHHINSD